MKRMIANVAFPVSEDGFTRRNLKADDEFAVNDHVAPGLKNSGLARYFGEPKPDGAAQIKPVIAESNDGEDSKNASQPNNGEAATGNDEAGAGAPPPDGDPVVIPDGWRDLHHLKMIPLAKQIDPSVSTKADAIAAIEKHLAG